MTEGKATREDLEKTREDLVAMIARELTLEENNSSYPSRKVRPGGI